MPFLGFLPTTEGSLLMSPDASTCAEAAVRYSKELHADSKYLQENLERITNSKRFGQLFGEHTSYKQQLLSSVGVAR